ncbi:hypothetical protein KGF54_001747 [Candida jiufengensis]|uniref:uncharacterized protein n=1 Tax=Candida jiufengensis TaxID=497108 RepID=UPI002224C53E|nr:uncharacterized protein KGF54_001747 [Candida jiufengensis]KAI5955186.1 hypothetical protein KGF54_001747 [Candida jiufengensis]
MSTYSSPYKASNLPIYIDDSLSPVKLPTTNKKNPQVNHNYTPVKEITNLNHNDQLNFQSLRPPHTENITKTNYLNINSATKKSIKRNRSSISDTTINKPSRYSLTSPLRKKRLTSNLSSIKKSVLELDLTINKLNNDRDKRLQNFDRSSFSEIENDLSSPIKRNRPENKENNHENDNGQDESQEEEQEEDVIVISGRRLSGGSDFIEHQDDDVQEIAHQEEEVEIGRRVDTANSSTSWRKQSPINPQLSSDFEIDNEFIKDPSQTLTHSQFTKLINESRQERQNATPTNKITEPEPINLKLNHTKIKSPEPTNTESNYELSPLRHDIDIINDFESNEEEEKEQELNEYEDEPTENFLSPTNSKPIFSMNHIDKLEKEHEQKLNQLYLELNEKNQEIQNLQEQVNKQNDEEKRLVHSNELINITINTMEKEIASLNKQNKILESSNFSFKRKLNDYKISIIELETEARSYDDVKNKYEEFKSLYQDAKEENDELKNQLRLLELAKAELATKNQNLNGQINNIQKENKETVEKYEKKCSNWEMRFRKSDIANGDLQSFLDDALEENKKFKEQSKEHEKLIAELDKLIQASNQENETQVKELEAKYEIQVTDLKSSLSEIEKENLNLKLNLNASKQEISQINKSNEGEIKKLKEENKSAFKELEQLQISYKEDILEKKQELITISLSYEKLEKELKSKTNEINSSNTQIQSQDQKISNLNSQIQELTTQSQQDQSTISESTQQLQTYETKFTELITAIEKQTLEKQQLEKQVSNLTNKIQEVTEEKTIEIDNLVKYLHQEYSSKHSNKMNEIKLHYEQELNKKNQELKSLNRDYEFLSKNLENVKFEYNQLLQSKSE